MGVVKWSPVLAGVVLVGAACSSEPERSLPVDFRHDAAGSVEGLAAAADGEALHVVWVRAEDGGARLLHSASRDAGASWSDPASIETGQPAPDRVRRNNDVQLAVDGDALLVAWHTAGDGFHGSGPMVTARSDDGGASWSASPPPATLDDAESHGFMDLERDPDGNFHLVWLDGRKGQQGLHHASSADGGASWTVETVVEATCECCWNTLAHGNAADHILYRALEPRDMALAERAEDGRWQSGEAVGDFDWQVDACPHVGGGLAVTAEGGSTGGAGSVLHASVWTAHDDHVGLHYLTRRGDDEVWHHHGRLGSRDARYSSIAVLDSARAVVAWDEPDGIRATVVDPDGSAAPLRLGPEEGSATYPLAVRSDHGVHVLWTADDGHGRTTWMLANVRESWQDDK